MRAVFTALAVGALGCHHGDDPTDGDPTILPHTTPTDSGTTVETGTTTLGGAFIDASYFIVTGRFGFDPDTQTAVPFARNGEGLSDLELEVLILDGDAALEGTTTDNSCTVTLKTPGPLPVSSWAAAHGAWVGFDFPADAQVQDHCKDYGLPSDFLGDAGARVAQWTWGVGVGPLDPTIEQVLENSLPASQWAALKPYAVGAAGQSSFFTTAYGGDGYSIQGYAQANQVDGNFEIVVGGTGNPEPIPESDVHVDPTVTRAYYEVILGPFLGANLTLTPVSGR